MVELLLVWIGVCDVLDERVFFFLMVETVPENLVLG